MFDVIALVLCVISSLFLIVFILLHSGKGSGLSDMFGGTSSLSGGTALERRLEAEPAQVDARGMTMEGAAIELDRGVNRLWIDGAGNMSLPMRRGQRWNSMMMASSASGPSATRDRAPR